MKIKPVKLIPIKPMKRLHFGLDTDRDKLPDWKDCRPFDPRRQHITPSQTMRKRLRNIPVYVTDEPIDKKKYPKSYQISSREARKKAPEATRKFYATIKKYPSVVGDLERTQPRTVLFSSISGQQGEEEEDTSGWARWNEGGEVMARPPSAVYGISQEDFYKEHQISEKEDVPLIFPSEETAAEAEARIRKLQATTFHHELAHIRQAKEHGPYVAQELRRFYDYTDMPTEVEARAIASREMAKYETPPPSKKEVEEWFKRAYNGDRQ